MKKSCTLLLAVTSAMLLNSPSSGQYVNTGNRGLYFSKKNYNDSGIPVFSESRKDLPSPALDDNFPLAAETNLEDIYKVYKKTGTL